MPAARHVQFCHPANIAIKEQCSVGSRNRRTQITARGILWIRATVGFARCRGLIEMRDALSFEGDPVGADAPASRSSRPRIVSCLRSIATSDLYDLEHRAVRPKSRGPSLEDGNRRRNQSANEQMVYIRTKLHVAQVGVFVKQAADPPARFRLALGAGGRRKATLLSVKHSDHIFAMRSNSALIHCQWSHVEITLSD